MSAQHSGGPAKAARREEQPPEEQRLDRQRQEMIVLSLQLQEYVHRAVRAAAGASVAHQEAMSSIEPGADELDIVAAGKAVRAQQQMARLAAAAHHIAEAIAVLEQPVTGLEEMTVS